MEPLSRLGQWTASGRKRASGIAGIAGMGNIEGENQESWWIVSMICSTSRESAGSTGSEASPVRVPASCR